jgi:manganese/zinc/iron transport system permease protein
MSFVAGTVLLAVVTAVACSLPGVFIVLRKGSMLVDAIAHAVLPGIIVGYAITQDFDSPMLIAGAALAGVAVVLGGAWLGSTRLLTGDAPQGLIFPALFAVGIILVSTNFANIHLDIHVVLAGDLNLAAYEPLRIAGVAVGPQYLYVMLLMLLINAVFIVVLYQPLKVTTFDPAFATSLGIRTGVVNTAFMFVVAITVTAAFNAAGAILVVALMVTPPATAYLLSKSLPTMIILTMSIAVVGALAGFGAAYVLNAATSATMAVSYGVLFIVAVVVERLLRRRIRTSGQRFASKGALSQPSI